MTGLVLVVRDFAQREIKHWIFGAMIVGLVLSTLTSWIVIVVASGAAFLISETVGLGGLHLLQAPAFAAHHDLQLRLRAARPGGLHLAGLAAPWPGIFAWGTMITGIALEAGRRLGGLADRGAARAPRRTKRDESRVNLRLTLASREPLAHNAG